MFKIVMLEGDYAVERTARFYSELNELGGEALPTTVRIQEHGDALLESKIPYAGSAIGMLAKGGEIIFQLDKAAVLTARPLRDLASLADDEVIFVIISPEVVSLPTNNKISFIKTEGVIRAMMEIETDTYLDTTSAANRIKELMAPRKKKEVEVTPAPAQTAVPTPVEPAQTIEKFLGEKFSPDVFAKNIVSFMDEDGRFMIPDKKVSSIIAEAAKATEKEKAPKNKQNPSDVIKRLSAKLSASNAPKKAIPTYPDDLHCASYKIARFCISKYSEDMIDELYKINSSKFSDRVKRLNSLAFEALFDACTNKDTNIVTNNSLSRLCKSIFTGTTINLSMQVSASDRPSYFKSPGTRTITNVSLQPKMRKNDGKLEVYTDSAYSDVRIEWITKAAIAIVNKYLERSFREDSAFEDCLYAQCGRLFHHNVYRNRIHTAQDWDPNICPTEGMKYILAAAASKLDLVDLEGLRVMANPGLPSILEEAGMEATPEKLEEAKHAIENWNIRSLELAYYTNDAKECSLYSLIPASSASLRKSGLTTDLISEGAKVGVDVSVYMSALAAADILLSYIAELANMTCEMASNKVMAVYYVDNKSASPVEVLYGLGNSSPHIVETFTKYKRKMYSAIPLEMVLGESDSKLYGYHAFNYDRCKFALKGSLDNRSTVMKSNMTSVASMLKDDTSGYLNTAMGMDKIRPIMMMYNGLQEYIWSNHVRHATSANRIKLESMFESVINTLSNKMYVITDRRPLIPEEIRYRDHYTTVYKEKKVSVEITSHEYMFMPTSDTLSTDLPESFREYVSSNAAAMRNKRGRIGSKMDTSLIAKRTVGIYHNCRGMIDPNICDEVLNKSRIIFSIAGGAIGGYYPTTLGHYIECDLAHPSRKDENTDLNPVSENSEMGTDLGRAIKDVLEAKPHLEAKYPGYVMATKTQSERGYITEGCAYQTKADLRSNIISVIAQDALSAHEKNIPWTDTAALKSMRNNRGSANRATRPLIIAMESTDLTRVMYLRNGMMLKDKDLIKYRILNALAYAIGISEFVAPTQTELYSLSADKVEKYVEAEISKVLRANKKRLIKDSMESRTKKLRAMREDYAKAFRESIPIIRSASKELREISGTDEVISDEQKIARLIESGEILGARVCGGDISVLLPQANIWAYASIYNIGKITLVLSAFGTSNAQAFFFCNDHLETRYPREVAMKISATENRTIDAPHVRNGVACYGNIAPALRESMGKGDLTSTILLCKSYVNSVNLNDGYGNNIYKWPSVPATLYNLVKFGVLHAGHVTQLSRVVFTPERYCPIESMTWDMYATAYESWMHMLNTPGYVAHEYTKEQWERMSTLNGGNSSVAEISYHYGKTIIPEVSPSVVRRSEEILQQILKDPEAIQANQSKKSPYDMYTSVDLATLIPPGLPETEMDRIKKALEVIKTRRQEVWDAHAKKAPLTNGWTYVPYTTSAWQSVYSWVSTPIIS